MENTGGRLNFAIGLDNKELLNDAQKCKDLLASIGTTAVEQGSVMDKAFGAAGAAKQFTNLEAAIRVVGKSMDDLDFGTAEEKIGALSYIINKNEGIIKDNVEQLNKWKQQAQEAFEKGDTTTLEELNKKIDNQVNKIQELNSETQTYKGTLQAVLSESGMATGTATVHRLFDSQADIKALEELKEKIQETQKELYRVGASGGDTSQLTAQLSKMKDQLNETEKSAAQAAAALGEDLGGRAAEAQQKLYQLNTAVADQQSVVDKLKTALEEARSRYEELQGSNDATAEELEMAASSYDTLSESLANAQQQLIGLQSAQQAAQGKWQELSEEIQGHDTVMVKMLGGYENYQTIVKQLPQPVQSAIKGIQGMTGAAKAFIATPVGAIIAAIVLALQAMKTWLNSTVEGQLKFAEITGFVSGILGQLKEIVIKVGHALFKAFSDPKQAISDLWEAIKTNVVNRFKAVGDIAGSLGKIIKAAFTLDTDGIKQGLKEMGESFVQLGTGVDNLTDKVGNWAKGVRDAASETAAIKRETRELEIQESEWQKRNQEIEQAKAKARGTMYNSSLSAEQRKKAMEEYKSYLVEQNKMEAQFADKKVELQQRKMALTSNTIEDENTLRELQAQRMAVDTKLQQELASLQRREGMIVNKGQSEENAAIKEAEAKVKALTSLGELQADLLIKNEEMELAIMEEGHAKRRKEIELSKTKEEKKLKEMQNKFIQLNKTAGVEVGENGLTAEQDEQLQKARLQNEALYAKQMEQLLKSELSSILTYEQTRAKVQEKYNAKRAALFEADGTTLKKGVTQANVDELEYQRNEALKAVDEEFASREESYQAWCNTIAEKSLESLETMLEQAKAALEELSNDPNADPKKLAEARAMVARLQEAKKKKTAEKDAESPSKRSIQDWKDLGDALEDCKEAFDEIGDEVGGLAGEIISTAGSVMSSSMAMINGIVQLANWSVTAEKMAAEGASKSIQAVEKASVILTIVSTAFQITMEIINFFKGQHDKKAQAQIDGLQTKIDSLQDSYEELGKAVERAYSKDASNLIEQQNELLKQQQDAIRQQIALEESKKNSDQDRIREWKDKLKEIDETIKDNKEAAINAIFGEDLQSAIDNFAESYADAWAEGENRSKSAKDTVKKMMQQMVQESIKAAIQSSGAMERIRAKLQEFYADGIFTKEEEAEALAMAQKLQEDLDRQFGWADGLMGGDSERQGASKGIASASQDSIDELNGRTTAIQGHTFSIAENTKNLVQVTTSILASVLNIEDNTDKMNDRMAGIESSVREVRSTLDDIALKGVKIK